jgi:hypothetical protein
MTVASDRMTRPIRGKTARFARFGKVAPLIPRVSDDYASLYELQQRTKQQKPEVQART